MDVTMLLCDHAVESGGKLFVLGGGWSVLRGRSPMALAIKLSVPWDQANKPHSIRAVLLSADGDEVDAGEGPVVVEGQVEVGRPPGLKPGTPLDSPFALNFPAFELAPGGYVWELEVDGTTMARNPFTVLEPAGAQ